MNTINNLLPIGTRVTHFGGGPSTHGKGVIIKHNGVKSSTYLEEKPEEAIKLASEAGLMGGIIASFYSGSRCPYVVHWDPSEKYPEGYKDVYEPESVQVVPPQIFKKDDKLKAIWVTDEDGESCEGRLIWGEIVTMMDRTSDRRPFIIVERANGRKFQYETKRFELVE